MTNHLCLPRTVLPLKFLYPENPPCPGTTKHLVVSPEEEKHQAQSEGYRHVPERSVAKTVPPVQGPGSMPGPGARSLMPQQKTQTWNSQINKY